MNPARTLLAGMLSVVLLVGVAMFLDEQREFDNAVLSLRDEQVALATAVGADFEARLLRMLQTESPSFLSSSNPSKLLTTLLGGAAELQQARSRILLVLVPQTGLVGIDGKVVSSRPLEEALKANVRAITLSREEAAQLGLPYRMAVAGIRASSEPSYRGWGVVVVASAERLRAKERHAQLRFSLGLVIVTLLVAVFGGVALRDQRRRLEAARELEIAALRRESERLLAEADKMATLAALSSGIAHQIATPLGTIVARVEQILPAVSDLPKATSALTIISDQVQRIQRIISGVLDLARGNRPTLVQTRPEAIVHATLALVQHRLSEAKVVVELAIAQDLPAIACDPPLLEQALVNIVLNATEASPQNSMIWINVTHGSEHVGFVVEDEGETISDETAQRAREPFFTTKARERGTGLGLAIAHEVVANHGGKLTLGPRAGSKGTRAAIEIPTTS